MRKETKKRVRKLMDQYTWLKAHSGGLGSGGEGRFAQLIGEAIDEAVKEALSGQTQPKV